MELTQKEKEIFLAYSADLMDAKFKFEMLKAMFSNITNIALSARGLSVETHRINPDGSIDEIKTDDNKK